MAVFIGGISGTESPEKKAKSIVRGTDYTLALYLPYRTDFYLKGSKGKFGQNSLLASKGENDKWSVYKRKYTKEKGGYYQKLKSGLTQIQAYNYIENIIK